METHQTVFHPHFGSGRLLNTFVQGLEWEVLFENGRRFRLPAREFTAPVQLEPLNLQIFDALQMLEALRIGIVPIENVDTLTIGLESERTHLNRSLARSRENAGDAIAVIGDYGFGKSHFIELSSRQALRDNFIVANASLDLVETPPSKARKIYETLVQTIRYPDTDERGLKPLLDKATQNAHIITQFVELSPRGAKDCPLASALSALQQNPTQSALEVITDWLHGQTRAQIPLKNYIKKAPTLYTTGESARLYSYLITGISVLAQMLGYSGLAVFIDESEHYSLLRQAQRERADSFFKAMIHGVMGDASKINPSDIPDHNRVEYPISFATQSHLFFVFALTESEDRMPVGSWLAPSQIIRLDDRFIEKDIRTFFETLLAYHQEVYGYSVNERYEPIQTNVPKLFYKAISQHRINLRELIRGTVAVCDLLYLYADYDSMVLLDELKSGLKI